MPDGSPQVTPVWFDYKDGRIRKDFLVDILDEHFSESEAEKQFQTLVDWGRYAQLFEYDSDEERLYKVTEEPKEDEGGLKV